MRNIYSMLIASIVMLVTGTLIAQSSPDGLTIIKNVYNRPQPKDQQGVLTMSLINSKNEQRVREIKQFISNKETVEKKLMFFISPADVRNTSFMNWSYVNTGKDDDQWIYLPALKKTKRISSEGKSDYFMGSDFTYDDLGDRQPEEDEHTLVREEQINNINCYVVKSTPRDKGYLYSSTVSWIDKEKWVGVKKEFYDEDGKHLKTLTVKESKKMGGFWMIVISEMHNVQKNHRTRMELKDITVDQGISDAQFSERAMMRGM
ncbi:MAG: outer membrane lipoprotein-sorting protein [Fibrobacteres bacterium]|nr:outer membrane lipoprotein-sorting protein [Fibrobacterota bacterium]